MKKIFIPLAYIKKIVKKALIEDTYPSGDITSSLIKNNKTIRIANASTNEKFL